MKMNWNNFIDDDEKINDLFYLNKEEFLKSYSYITEEEYENTIEKMKSFIAWRKTQAKREKEKADKNRDEVRKRNMDFYYAHREEINARRRAKRAELKNNK